MTRIIIDISILLNIIGFGQGLFLSVSLWRTKGKRPENIFLIYLLISISLIILNSVFRLSYYSDVLDFYENFSNSFLLVIAPAIFSFIQFKLGRVEKLNQQLQHFLPFLIYFTFNLAHFIGFESLTKINEAVGAFFYVIFNLQFLVYFGVTLIRIKKIDPLPDTVKWLRIAILTIAIPWFLQLAFVISEQAFGIFVPDFISLNLSLLFGICSFFLSYVHTSGSIGFAKGAKYEGSIFSSEQLANYITVIEKVIKENKLYLDKDLSIAKISSHTQLKPRDISQIINQGLSQGFTDFINGYRVEAFKKMIKEESSKNFTIVAIATDCGFKSSSSFYAAFKKHTGITPNQYKDNL